MSTNANAKSSVNVKVRDFCGKSKLFFILSAVLVVLSILSTFLSHISNALIASVLNKDSDGKCRSDGFSSNSS